MKYSGILILGILTLSLQGLGDDTVEQAIKMYPELSTASLASANRKDIEFRNGDHDDSSKMVVTILDGERAQISCVDRFVVGNDSADVKKIQNGYPFSKDDLDARSNKWFYGTTRIIGENAELIRKISSFMGPDSPITGEHREIIHSSSTIFERCMKLDKALKAANTRAERMAYSRYGAGDYKVTSSNGKTIDREPLSDKKSRRD